MILCLMTLTAAGLAVGKIKVAGLFKDKAVISIDGKQRILEVGDVSPEGVKLISATSTGAVLEVDGEQRTYALGEEISSTYTGPVAGETVTIAPDPNGMYYIHGSINGFQVSFVVDTGATLISMNRNEARRIGLDYKLKGVEALAETASGHSKIYLVKLKEVTIGNITLRDVDASVHDDDFPTVILLGNSFLGRINMNREGMLLQLKN